MTILFFIAFILLLSASLFIIIPTIYAGIIGAPLVLTPKNAIREALRKIGAKKGEKLYELGAGTGRTLLIADKEFGLDTIGFELSPIVYWFAKLNLFFSSAKKSKIYRRNAYNQNLQDANIVFCFLSTDPMERLKSKFLEELRPGTRIVSYAFSIKGWKPEEIISDFPPGKVFLYKIK